MAFNQEPVRTPTGIRNVVIHLKDAFDEDDNPIQGAYFDIQIVLSDGSIITRHGDLVPHITAAQRTGLLDFMASLRVQAETQIL